MSPLKGAFFMEINMSLVSDFQKLEVDGLINLYELDARNLGAGILRFHGHASFKDNGEWKPNIIWQGETYEPLAIKVSELELRSDGKASTPSLAIANNINGIQGAVSAYCLQFKDFADAKLKVIITMAKYLDALNFSTGNPNAANESKEQIWYIEQKTSENAQQVTFELSNPIDNEGREIPVRQITSLCEWACKGRYRGEECGYTGTAMYTEKGELTDDPAQDKCGGRLRDCRLHFGENQPLSYGGFPASNLM